MAELSSVRTLLFLQEEYGCYGTLFVPTTATIQEIKQWWSEGGFHPFADGGGHFPRRPLPGTEVFSRESIVWKRDLVPLEKGWHPVTWPKPGDVFHFAEEADGGRTYDSKEFEFGNLKLPCAFIHFHMGGDDVLCVGEEEIPHPHAEEWDRAMFGEE